MTELRFNSGDCREKSRQLDDVTGNSNDFEDGGSCLSGNKKLR